MRRKTKTLYSNTDWLYLAGGNPPVAAGIFDGKGDRVAWWPAGYQPTQDRLEIVYRMIIARDDDKPLDRTKIRKAFGALSLSDLV